MDCSNASLGLRSDGYVTSFTLVFGTAKEGFAQVETPQIYVKVFPNLPNGYAGVIIGLSPKKPENTGVSPVQSQSAALGPGEIIPITSDIPRLW
ncbi:hypothetical protein AGMMS49975_29120 [Clostridia bacterium]|nr:hypothetical protein AGMMS49975_29120 [Clostridia bacterium]